MRTAGIGASLPLDAGVKNEEVCPLSDLRADRFERLSRMEIRHSFRRPEAAIRATAGEPSGYGPFSDARPGVKSGNMHRSAPLSSLFKPEQSLTGVPRLFVALELCSHAGTK